jgi:hypothetical protein
MGFEVWDASVELCDECSCGFAGCPTVPSEVPAEILAAEAVSEPLPSVEGLLP